MPQRSLLRKLGFQRRHLGLPGVRNGVRAAMQLGLLPPEFVHGAQLECDTSVTVGRFRFIYRIRDAAGADSIGAMLYWRGWSQWEPDVVPRFAEWAGDGGHVVDIGANTGFYSLLAASAGCTVSAFEPNPAIVPLLEQNVAWNRFEGQVKVFPCACGDRDGEISLHIHADPTMCSTVYAGEDSTVVPLRRLDSCLGEGVRTTLIKIDAEGAELAVLKGTRTVLERDRPRVIFECFDAESAAPIESFFRGLGYSLAWIGKGGGLHPIESIDVYRYGRGEHNFAAMP